MPSLRRDVEESCRFPLSRTQGVSATTPELPLNDTRPSPVDNGPLRLAPDRPAHPPRTRRPGGRTMSRTPPPTPSSPIIDAAVRSALPSGPRPPQPGTRKGRGITLALTPPSATDCPLRRTPRREAAARPRADPRRFRRRPRSERDHRFWRDQLGGGASARSPAAHSWRGRWLTSLCAPR
jgi:hypothetical protein